MIRHMLFLHELAAVYRTISALLGINGCCTSSSFVQLSFCCQMVYSCIIARNRKLHTATHIVIFSLSVSDFMVGLIVLPMIAFGFHIYLSTPDFAVTCMMSSCLVFSLGNISVSHMLLVTAERYAAIIHPFWHLRVLQKRAVIVISIVLWIISISIGFLPAYGWNKLDAYVNGTDGFVYGNYSSEFCSSGTMAESYIMLIFACALPLTMVLMASMYFHILVVIRTHRKNINLNRPINEQDHKLINEHRSTIIIGVLLGFSVLSWLPLIILLSISTLYKDYTIFPIWIYLLTNVLAFSNSSMNPLFYGLGHSGIRNALRQSIMCKKPVNPQGS